MFRPPLSNPAQKRTLRPLYANTQATPYGGFLDPDFDPVAAGYDILPGTVMQRVYGEVFAPFTGAANTTPFGLSALFVAPSLGVNEVSGGGTNLFTVWVGDSQAVFEILAPAFDVDAVWPTNMAGARVMLTANASGRLTPTGVDPSNVIAELIDVPSPDKIVVRLNRLDLAASGGGLAGGS
jgi:hypothetical protein